MLLCVFMWVTQSMLSHVSQSVSSVCICGCFDGVEDNFGCFDDVDGNCGRLDGVEGDFGRLLALGCFEDVGDSELLLFWAMTSTSSMRQTTPWTPSRISCMCRWKCSGADEIPNGRCWKQYLPNGVMNVVKSADSDNHQSIDVDMSIARLVLLMYCGRWVILPVPPYPKKFLRY